MYGASAMSEKCVFATEAARPGWASRRSKIREWGATGEVKTSWVEGTGRTVLGGVSSGWGVRGGRLFGGLGKRVQVGGKRVV